MEVYTTETKISQPKRILVGENGVITLNYDSVFFMYIPGDKVYDKGEVELEIQIESMQLAILGTIKEEVASEFMLKLTLEILNNITGIIYIDKVKEEFYKSLAASK